VGLHVARSRANIRFLQAVPKFVVDMTLIGGFLIVGGVAWLANGQKSALAAVAGVVRSRCLCKAEEAKP
jgi:ATP-binding cassette, subfamily B, bacterial PglK